MKSFSSMQRRRYFPFYLLLLLIASCAGMEMKSNTDSGNSTTVSVVAPANSEALTLYSQANALWNRPLSSVSAVAVSTDPQKAASLLDQAIALEPGYADAYRLRALARSELGLREEAFDDATKAILLHPTATAYAARGLVSLRARHPRGAERDLEYALTLEPGNALAHNYRGVVALAVGDTSTACDSFAKGCSNGDCAYSNSARAEKICR